MPELPERGVQYEFRTVKVIRGREKAKISELAKQRWEVVDQSTGTVRSELTFRRVKRSQVLLTVGMAALAAALFAVLGVMALLEDDPGTSPATTSASDKSSREEPQPSPSEEPFTEEEPQPSSSEVLPPATPTAPEESLDDAAVLTIGNSPALRDLLRADDDYMLNRSFARDYAGRTIRFDGSVADSMPGFHLVFFGDDSNTTATSGPAFQFRERSLIVDGRPVRPGDELDITARVGRFDAGQGLFQLEPVQLSQR